MPTGLSADRAVRFCIQRTRRDARLARRRGRPIAEHHLRRLLERRLNGMADLFASDTGFVNAKAIGKGSRVTPHEFKSTFNLLTGNSPFPWQEALYERFVSDRPDNIPSSCNLPTGLGKTSVVALWLIALMNHPGRMPRRLVYVVNRRTVVDQTTVEVGKIRENLGKLPSLDPNFGNLAISTLRGQYADNREWSADPSRPAVICGTVDMIGSRLLFSGYGLGFKTRPLHAGFLGQDALIVHDEAHLEPAFQELIKSIEKEQRSGRFPDRWPIRVMELSATSREGGGSFGLTAEDHENEFVRQRIHAKKTLVFYPIADEKKQLADKLVELAMAHEQERRTVLIFVRTVDDLGKVVAKLPKDRTQQLTGTMRGRERELLVEDEKIFKRFLPDAEAPEETVYLVCTSAGEVGVNLSGDHLVCDLSPFESMAQRLGRVNRFGLRDDTRVDIVHPTSFDAKNEIDPAREKTLALLRSLEGNGSPEALGNLDRNLDPEMRRAAFSPQPEILLTSDILWDTWALTTISGKLPGRPPAAEYLHGKAEWEPPQTRIAWRDEVGEITGDLLNEYPPEELLESYPLKPHELLTDHTDRIFKTLGKLEPETDVPVWIVNDEGEISIKALSEIVADDKDDIAGATLLLPPQAGGLDEKGSFSSKPHDAALSYDVADAWQGEHGFMRKRDWQERGQEPPQIPPGMKLVQRIAFADDNDEDAPLKKTWHWFVRVLAADADVRSRKSYPLQPHLLEAKDACSCFVMNLRLEPELRDAVILAARCHDLGKDRERWQNGIGNYLYPQEKWAKSGKRLKRGEFSSYRHEFGSVLDVQKEEAFASLSPDMRDLVLHLIAAHHGRGRPHFNADECFDDNNDAQAARDLAIEAPRRFARLQRKYGRWGLAYLESLVRAADYEASQKAEEEGAK